MSYRNITVNNKTYQYTIGRTFVKIKGFGIFSKQDHGTKLVGEDRVILTPENIKNIILGMPRPVFHCKSHNTTTDELTIDPFNAEIYRKTVYIINCPECLRQSRDNI